MKCSFCGGSVVNGRCQDCGMPYREEQGYTLRSGEESAHTHEVNGEKILHRVRKTPGKTPFYTCPPEKRASARPRDRQPPRRGPAPRKDSRSRAGQILSWVVLLAVVLELLPALFASCSA